MPRNAVDKMFNILSFYLLCPSARRRVSSVSLLSASFIMIIVRSMYLRRSLLAAPLLLAFLSTGYSICTGFSGNDFASIRAHLCMRVFLNAFSIRVGWSVCMFFVLPLSGCSTLEIVGCNSSTSLTDAKRFALSFLVSTLWDFAGRRIKKRRPTFST